MAIGTMAAIGLGAAGVGSVLSSKSQSKAQKQAAQTAADTSLQVAQQNNALAREIYGQNRSALAPYMERGNAASSQINALLGLAPGGAQAANQAFDVFRGSTGYDFRLGEGMNALNTGYAGAGLVRSGAAMKAAQQYGQNMASQEFGNYLGYLSNQQGVGLSGASALAGVAQNYSNSVMANNDSAGTAAANAALATANRPNVFGNALSMIGGGLFGLGR